MFNFFRRKKNIDEVVKRKLKENIGVINSLRDYDEGKKDISTTQLEQRLLNIRLTSQG